MKFEVRLSKRAQTDLAGVPRAVQLRVVAKLNEASNDPVRFFRRLKGSKTLRLRVGDYRILADIDAGERLVWVHHIGHRKNVYD